MRKSLLLIMLLLLSFVSAAYAGDLADIKADGTLRMGVFPEALPFAFYDEDGELTGIDIALMDQIAQRMGVSLEVFDMSPDSLQESLEIGQIDVIGGAFSKTKERRQVMDFSKIYFSAEPVFVAKSSLTLPQTLTESSFKGLRIGVQKGNALEEWLKSDQAEKGVVKVRDIYTFSGIQDAMRSLDKEKIDLFFTDADIFSYLYPDVSAYQTRFYGNAKNDYAFAVRKGSDLKAEINKHLTDLLTDGTAQQIADHFFSGEYIKPQQIVNPGIKIPAAVSTATPLPPISVKTATPLPAKCTDVMMFVSDVTIPDGMKIGAGTAFTKTWRVRNTGTCTWTPAYTFNFVSGNRMNGWNQNIPRNVYPGESIDISVDMVAPGSPGNYKGSWQLTTAAGYSLGTAIYVEINVPGGYSYPTAVPTEPYYGPVQEAVKAVINYYYPNFYKQDVGKCVNLYWGVDQNSMAELFVDGVSVYMGSESQYMMQICNEVQGFGPHEITLCAYSVGGDVCETVTYVTDPAGTPFSP